MKRMLAIIAALLPMLAFSPLLAQEVETLPDGRRVKIIQKDGATIIEEVKEDEAEEESAEAEELDEVLPAEVRELLKRLREKAEKAGEEGDWEDIEEGGVKIRIRGLGKDHQLPEDVKKSLEEMRERFKKMHEELEERMKKMREELEKSAEEWENDPDAEVEEYEKTSPDGSSTVKIKIVRIRKSSKSEDSTPEAPKKETERKQ
jgi:flagellar motility protein MotE (MotC chaperone)